MKNALAWLRARVFGNPRTTSIGVAIACAGAGLIFGAEAVRAWASDLTAGGALAVVVLGLLAARDPGQGA